MRRAALQAYRLAPRKCCQCGSMFTPSENLITNCSSECRDKSLLEPKASMPAKDSIARMTDEERQWAISAGFVRLVER